MTLEIRNIDGTGRGGRRRKQLQNELVEKRRYGQLKEEALDGALCRSCLFEFTVGPVVMRDNDSGWKSSRIKRKWKNTHSVNSYWYFIVEINRLAL
jgi:hypothetical protein